MRRIVLSPGDYKLFNADVTFTDFDFMTKHWDTFRRMWKEQGKPFWIRFLTTFRSFAKQSGCIKDLADIKTKLKLDTVFDELIDEGFIFIHENFIDGKYGDVKTFMDESLLLAELSSNGMLQNLGAKSLGKDPFYSRISRDSFRHLFGPPKGTTSFIKVILLKNVYIQFCGAVINCLRRWLEADDALTDEETNASGLSLVKRQPMVTDVCMKCLMVKGEECPRSLNNSDFVTYLLERKKGHTCGPYFVQGWDLHKDPRFHDPKNPFYSPEEDPESDWRENIDFCCFEMFLEYVKETKKTEYSAEVDGEKNRVKDDELMTLWNKIFAAGLADKLLGELWRGDKKTVSSGHQILQLRTEMKAERPGISDDDEGYLDPDSLLDGCFNYNDDDDDDWYEDDDYDDDDDEGDEDDDDDLIIVPTEEKVAELSSSQVLIGPVDGIVTPDVERFIPSFDNPEQGQRLLWNGELEWNEQLENTDGSDSVIKLARTLKCRMFCPPSFKLLNPLAKRWSNKLQMNFLPPIMGKRTRKLFNSTNKVIVQFEHPDVDPLASLYGSVSMNMPALITLPRKMKMKFMLLVYDEGIQQFVILLPNDRENPATLADGLLKIINKWRDQQRRGEVPRTLSGEPKLKELGADFLGELNKAVTSHSDIPDDDKQSALETTVNQVAQDIAAEVIRCARYLSCFRDVAARNVCDNHRCQVHSVNDLIQDLVDGVHTPEWYAARVQIDLNCSPQPYLVPFLNETLPYLREFLYNDKIRIVGIHPPPKSALQKLPASTESATNAASATSGEVKEISVKDLAVLRRALGLTSTGTESPKVSGGKVPIKQEKESTKAKSWADGIDQSSTPKGKDAPKVTESSEKQSAKGARPKMESAASQGSSLAKEDKSKGNSSNGGAKPNVNASDKGAKTKGDVTDKSAKTKDVTDKNAKTKGSASDRDGNSKKSTSSSDKCAKSKKKKVPTATLR